MHRWLQPGKNDPACTPRNLQPQTLFSYQYLSSCTHMSSDSAKAVSMCLAFGRAARSQKHKLRAGTHFKKLAQSEPQILFPRYSWENTWTAVLPAGKGGHRCLTILIQSFSYSINAHFQIKSSAKVEVKVVPVPLVCLPSSTISDG